LGSDSRIGVRAQVFLITVAIVVVAVFASGLYLDGELRGSTRARVEDELLRHAKSSRDLLQLSEMSWEGSEIDSVADHLGESIDARVTFISSDGTVVGDSARTLEQLAAFDNHADRPEVIDARSRGSGVAHRRSATTGADMIYAAVRLDSPTGGEPTAHGGEHGGAVVRVARWQDEVEQAMIAVRVALLLAGLLAVAVAVAFAFFVSGRLTRQLRELVDAAHEASAGERPDVGAGSVTGGESGRASSLGGLSDELEGVVRTLALERNRFEAVLKSMDEAVLAIDVDGKVIAANRAARKTFSLHDKVVGRSLIDVVRVPELEGLAKAALAGEKQAAEFVLQGSGQTILARARPNVRETGLDEDGEAQPQPEGAVLVLHDVTEVRRLETVRQDFVANVSHELRTPVSIIRAHTDTLLAGAVDEPEQARRFLEPVRRSAERLGQLIADLLDISRIDRGKYELEHGALSVSMVTGVVSQSVAQAAAKRGIEVEIRVPDGCSVMGDRHALEQILINLVENAIKYGPEEDRVTLVATYVETDRRGVRIEVADNGPGIPAEHRGRVFERFYRVDPGRSRAMGGTGLGLAIVKNLAEAMGGEVGFDPREPRGSSFWVWLEAAPQEGDLPPGRGPNSARAA
jgi:two-component system phosphate regulon sensor histidine kinase PhoR